MVPHMLVPFAPEIWIADGSTVATAGFRYRTRMIVIRLPDQALWVWSPIPPCDGLRAEINALGPVRFVVAPNSLHHLFISDWLAAWPEAKGYAAPGLPAKRPDVGFARELDDAPVPEWGGAVEHVVVRGNLIATEVVFFHRLSGTVLFTDLLQNFPAGWFRGWRAVVAWLDLMTETEPCVPRKFRMSFVNRSAARASVQRILAWPVERVLAAHATPVARDGHALLARAFKWLRIRA